MKRFYLCALLAATLGCTSESRESATDAIVASSTAATATHAAKAENDNDAKAIANANKLLEEIRDAKFARIREIDATLKTLRVEHDALEAERVALVDRELAGELSPQEQKWFDSTKKFHRIDAILSQMVALEAERRQLMQQLNASIAPQLAPFPVGARRGDKIPAKSFDTNLGVRIAAQNAVVVDWIRQGKLPAGSTFATLPFELQNDVNNEAWRRSPWDRIGTF